MTGGVTRRALGTIRQGLRELLSVRWIRWTAALLLVALLARAAAEQVLAFTARRLAAERGLACTWEDLDLALLSGRGEIHGLDLRPLRGEGEEEPGPLLELEYGVFDLDVLELFTGNLSISRAEVDGLHSWWIRDVDGTWNVEQHVDVAHSLALLQRAPETEESRADAQVVARPLDLSPGLTINALRFQNAVCKIVDHAVDPPLALDLRIDASLSHLDHRERPARFSASILGGDLFNAAHIEGQATWNADGIELALRARAGSIHPRQLAQYLEPLDIRPVAESIEARLLCNVHVAVIGEARDTLRASVDLSKVFLRADGAESLALDLLEIKLDSWSRRGAVLPGIEIQGIRGRASLEADSSLRIAGLELTGTSWFDSIAQIGESVSPEQERKSGGPPGWLSLVFREDPDAVAWSLGSFGVRDGLLDFTDRTVEPESSFPLFIDSVVLGEVEHVPGGEKRTIPIDASLRAPGMAETIVLTGSLGPFAPNRSIDLDLQIDGIVLESLGARMQSVGVERALHDGSFHARLVGAADTDEDGLTRGRLALERVALDDGRSLFGIRAISAEGLLFDPAQNLVRFGDVEVSGTRLAVVRDPSRRFFALGLRTLGISPGHSEPPAAGPGKTLPTAASGASAPSPRFEFVRLAWIDSDVEFVDELTDPPQTFGFNELALELTNLTLGGDPDGPQPEPALFSARVVAPGLVDELTLSGQVISRPGPLDLSLELALNARGGTGELIEPYLTAIGVEPDFTDAILAAGLEAHVKREPDAWSVGFTLRDASLHDGESLLLSIEELRLDEVRLGERIEVGSIDLVAPRAAARRDEEGALVLAGLRLLRRDAVNAGSADEREAVSPSLPELPALVVRHFGVEDARLSWSDARLSPTLETELVLGASVTDLRTDGVPGAFEARLHVPETVERLELRGTFTLSANELGLVVNLDGEGLRPGPLARLLPDDVRLEASAGRLHAELAARVGTADDGGLQLDLAARDFSWGEEGAEPWIALARAGLRAPRIDPAGGVITVGPITVEGLRLDAARDVDGTVHLAGLALGGARRETPEVAPDVGAEAAAPDSQAARPAWVLPRIELVEAVTLQLERLRLRDARLGEQALPLEVAATFQLETPLVVIDPQPGGLAPIRWRLDGRLAGIAERWGLSGELTPFAAEPGFGLRLEASGIRTAGVVERVPLLAQLLEGEVEEGTLAGSMRGTFQVRRARPTELGFARPFGADIEFEGLEFRDRPGGTILAGVERIGIDVQRVDTAQGLVHVDSLEVLEPRGFVRRKDMTLHALGFAIHLDGAVGEPAAAQESSADGAQPAASGAVAVEASAPPPSAVEAELRIDQLVVQGLDFEFVDETSDPPVRIPLTKLDAEVRRITTLARAQDRPLHFSSFLESGEDGQAVFAEVALAGQVALHPELAGWAQLSVTGLELRTLAPLAAIEGLTLEDGALDASVRLRLRGARGVKVDTQLVFTDLDMDEPEGGILESAFSLPMTLDAALFLLRNAAGEHRFSAGFSVGEDGVSDAQIATAAAGAFAEVLARALAAVPLRLLGMLLPGGDEDEAEPKQTWSLAFVPGAATPVSPLVDEVRRAVNAQGGVSSRVLVLRHELTSADLAQAERLANPSPQTCLELVKGLRQRRAMLLRALEEASTQAQALYAIGDPRAPAIRDTVRTHERELAQVEGSLDQLLEILRSDSPRQRQKRTRTTALEIADLRLQALRESLRRNLERAAWDQLEIRPPRFETVPGEGGGRVVVELRQR